MAIIQIPGFKCDICGHEWLPNDRDLSNLPTSCAKCKSPNWNIKASKKYNPESKSNLRS